MEEEAVPIIHDTAEHGSETRAGFVCTVRGKRVRRFRCLLSRLPQIRFVSGTRCSDYQAGKKKKKRRRGIGAAPRLINSERKSCSLGDILRSRDFLDSFYAGFLRFGFRLMDRDSNICAGRWLV